MNYSYQFEEWRDIPEYFGLYQISNFGRVRSLVDNHGNKREKILRPSKDNYGYLRVCLCKDGKAKMFLVHRLVALAFIPNPDNLPVINHKDENPSNNRVSNLEWCNHKYNINYGSRLEKVAEKRSKSVNQFTKEGILIGSYPSAREAERQTGYAQSNISHCCNGRYKQAYGYIWKYA